MLDYKTYLTNIINRRDYELSALEEKIDKCWLDGKITEADRDSLMALAAENARDSLQVDFVDALAKLERRVWALEHPEQPEPEEPEGEPDGEPEGEPEPTEPQYVEWYAGYTTQNGEIVLCDVTGDGELDLCRYDGGRGYTSLSIGKINGWHLLNDQLENVADITRDASGGYVITPINAEPEPEQTEVE